MCVYMHVLTQTVESPSGGVCVCTFFCVGVKAGGLHQYSAVAPYEECVGGG